MYRTVKSTDKGIGNLGFSPSKGTPFLFPSSIILLCFQRMVLGFYGPGDTVVQDSTPGLQGSRFRILLSRTSKESTWIIWWVSGEGQMIDDHEGLKQGTASTTIVEVEEEAGLSCEKAEPKPSYSLNPSPPLPLVLQLQKSSQRWVDFCRCSHLYIWFFFCFIDKTNLLAFTSLQVERSRNNDCQEGISWMQTYMHGPVRFGFWEKFSKGMSGER